MWTVVHCLGSELAADWSVPICQICLFHITNYNPFLFPLFLRLFSCVCLTAAWGVDGKTRTRTLAWGSMPSTDSRCCTFQSCTGPLVVPMATSSPDLPAASALLESYSPCPVFLPGGVAFTWNPCRLKCSLFLKLFLSLGCNLDVSTSFSLFS